MRLNNDRNLAAAIKERKAELEAKKPAPSEPSEKKEKEGERK